VPPWLGAAAAEEVAAAWVREGEEEDAEVGEGDVDDDFVTDASEAVADEITPTAEFTLPRKLTSGFELEELCASTLLALSTANEAARK